MALASLSRGLPERSSLDALAGSGETPLPLSKSIAGLPWRAVSVTVLAVCGVAAIAPAALALIDLWKTDPLKSVGGVIPFASLVLLLRAWRSTGWRAGFSWWGPALLLATALAVQVRERAVVELVLTRSWTLSLPPVSLTAVAYAASCALFFGGARLLWVARFPVCLMALVNPVPHVFVHRVDLPLQHLSAHLARSFAQLAGAHLTSGQLRLMFTPDFGMFIAPGCDGMRGAVTMGMITLVAGHVYRLRARRWAGLVVAGVALGYLFNFLRLCLLVLYYVLALHLHFLQDHAEGADYLLGGSLFFGAAVLLFSALHDYRSEAAEGGTPATSPPAGKLARPGSVFAPAFAFRCALFLAFAGLGAVPLVRGVAQRVQQERGDSAAAEAGPGFASAFPSASGGFLLRRTWDESLPTGTLLFHWAEYAPASGSRVIAVGVSPTLGAHDTMLCHVARGEDWLWHGGLPLRTRSGQLTTFSASFYNDGVTQFVEATTVCTGNTCGQYTVGGRHSGLIYSRITPETLLRNEATRPVPLLLRAETTDVLMAPQVARELLTKELQTFVAGIEPASLGALLGRSAR